jgi:hypothetical protein
MATPRKVGKTIWNQEMARAFRANGVVRRACTKLLEVIQRRPVPVQLAAIYIGNILSSSGECVEALRVLQEIAQEAASDD